MVMVIVIVQHVARNTVINLGCISAMAMLKYCGTKISVFQRKTRSLQWDLSQVSLLAGFALCKKGSKSRGGNA